MRYPTILLFGAPGAGKGTQGRILAQVPGLFHLSCGDVFRSLKPDSRLGRIFDEYSSRGALVPDSVTIELWESALEGARLSGAFDPDRDLLILDGIPRNRAQARMMEERIEVLRLIHLQCRNRAALFDRLRRRALRENRYDDASDAVISHRLEVYQKETALVLDYYPADRIVEVDADQSPLLVLASLAHIIDGVRVMMRQPA
ncbi:MAG TPA: nucleoside monophosphate kinase [Limnochordia bacterium]